MAPIITIENIDQAISGLDYRNPEALKYKLIYAIRAFYGDADSVLSLQEIDAGHLIKHLWDVGDDTALLKSRRKNLSSAKSAVNKDLKAAYKDGRNPGGVIIGRDNIFVMSDEAKDKLLSTVGSEGSDPTGASLQQIAESLEAIEKTLAKTPDPTAIADTLGKHTLDNLREMVQGLAGKIGVAETGVAPPQEEIDAEETDTLETVEDDELVEVIEETTPGIDDLDAADADSDQNLKDDVEDDETTVPEADEAVEVMDDFDAEPTTEGGGEPSVDGEGPSEEEAEVGLPESPLEGDVPEMETAEEAAGDEAAEEVVTVDEVDEALALVDPDDPAEIDDRQWDAAADSDEIPEDEMGEDEIGEDEIGEDEILEDEIPEGEPPEDEILEDVIPEDEIPADDVEDDEVTIPEADEEVEVVDDFNGDMATEAFGQEAVEESGADGEGMSAGTAEVGLPESPFEGEDPEHDPDPEEKSRLLAEAFDGYLGAMERYYNQYLLVPQGTYLLGSAAPGERPPVHVDLPDFYIGKYPVTNALFEVFVERTGYVTVAEEQGYSTVYQGRLIKEEDEATGRIRYRSTATVRAVTVPGACWYRPGGPETTLHQKRNHPAVHVAFKDAMAFAAWTGKRLPREDEWEAAARTLRSYVFPWGNEWKDNACNTEETALADTTPVDTFKEAENELAIGDTLGNVLEWTSDRCPSSVPTHSPIRYQILKGGSWVSQRGVNLTARFKMDPLATSNIVGFRCAVD